MKCGKGQIIRVVDSHSSILDLFNFFLSSCGYRAIYHREPYFCSLYLPENCICGRQGCSDMLIIECEGDGIRLLQEQSRRGCTIDARNKAIISSNLRGDTASLARQLGCGYFEKPFRWQELSQWLRGCEERLSREPGITEDTSDSCTEEENWPSLTRID